MRIESRPSGKDIDAWQPVESRSALSSRPKGLQVERLARELTRKVYGLTKKAKFSRDFGLKGQIQDAAGSTMHNTRPVKCLRM